MFDKYLLGKSYPTVHRIMDSTTKMSGVKHRRDPVHNPFFIYFLTGDINAFYAAMLHQILDNSVTKAKRNANDEWMKMFLESL